MRWFKPEYRFTLATILGGCIFVALQLVTLAKWNIWHDESFTLMLIQYDWGEMLRRASFDVHPPLYYLLLKGWAEVFGYSMVALRTLSVVCMTGVFGLSLWLIRRLAGKAAAWWALPALMLAPALVRYGQEIRMYGLACLLGLAATHVLLSLLKDSQKKWTRRWWGLMVAYVICLAALLYTHYFASLVIVVHWVVFLMHQRQVLHGLGLGAALARVLKREAWWFFSYAALVLSYLPWASVLWQQFTTTDHNFWVGAVSVTSPFSTISTFLFFHPAWLEWQLTGWYGWLMLAATGWLSYVVVLVTRSSKLAMESKILLVGYWSIPMLVVLLISLPPLTPYYFDRYFVVFAPLFYSLLGVGCWLAHERWRAKPVLRWILPLVVLAGLLLGTWNVQIYGNNFGHAKEDTFSMRDLSAELRVRWEPGDVVMADHLEQYFDAHFYLTDLTQVKYFTPTVPGRFGNTSVIFEREDLLVYSLTNLSSDSGRVWIITNFDQAPAAQVPSTWTQEGEPVIRGYARLTLFTLPQTFPQ